MPSGLDATGGWVGAPTDLPGFGDMQWQAPGWARAQVGGPDFEPSGFGTNVDTGFNRIATGEIDAGPVPGQAGHKVTDWRHLFNWEHNPMFWVLVFALAAVGFIHARLAVGGQVGPAQAGFQGGI